MVVSTIERDSTLLLSVHIAYMTIILGRLDRKIEFPLPNEEARAHIMRIHSRKMNVNADVNFEELSRCTEDFNGAQCKAICVEAVSSYCILYKFLIEALCKLLCCANFN